MTGPLQRIVGVAGSKPVQDRLIRGLQGVDVAWQDEDLLKRLPEKLRNNLFGCAATRGEVVRYPQDRKREQCEPPRWFDMYMPPFACYYCALRMGWRILTGEPGQVVDGLLVREIAAKGAAVLLRERDAEQYELLREADRYITLSPLKRSRAWLAMQLFVHSNQERINYCQCCSRYDQRSLDTVDYCVAVVSGIDTEVVQTEWLIYRGEL